jgi:hypothetical protein
MELQDPIFNLPRDLRIEIFKSISPVALSQCCEVSMLWLKWMEESAPKDFLCWRNSCAQYHIVRKSITDLSRKGDVLRRMVDAGYMCLSNMSGLAFYISYKSFSNEHIPVSKRLVNLALSTISMPAYVLATGVMYWNDFDVREICSCNSAVLALFLLNLLEFKSLYVPYSEIEKEVSTCNEKIQKLRYRLKMLRLCGSEELNEANEKQLSYYDYDTVTENNYKT